MIRVGGGTFRGRPLAGPKRGERSLRPTSGRAKQVLFDVLGPLDARTDVLDLFAGAGTLGFEALSRGAGCVTFVDRDARAVAMIERNAATLGVTDRVRIRQTDVARFLGDSADVWPLVLADPPYEAANWASLLDGLSGRVARQGRVVLEHASGERPSGGGFDVDRRREVGGTTWTILRPIDPRGSEEP